MRLIAIPYAFGNSNIFNEFFTALDPKLKPVSVEYPGHGRRIDEELITTMKGLTDDAFLQIKDYIAAGESYCLFGYSMGGLVAYELYYRILSEGLNPPSYIFILGTPEPSYQREKKPFETYTVEQIRKELKEYGGTPEILLEIDEFIELMAPIVKADNIILRDYCDFVLTEEYKNRGSVGCGVTVVRGSKETELENCKEGWEKGIGHEIVYMMIDGEHFFLFEKGGKNVSKVRNIVEETLKAKNT